MASTPPTWRGLLSLSAPIALFVPPAAACGRDGSDGTSSDGEVAFARLTGRLTAGAPKG